MRLETVDPQALKISPENERRQNVGTSDLEPSVREQGIIEAPIVRENGEGYEVVVGQRRTLAAQSVGLDEIEVRVADWDDREALRASITENADIFREDVSKADRARALQRLWQKMGNDGFPSPQKLGDELNDEYPRKTIDDWLEPLREAWEGTVVDPEIVAEESGGDSHHSILQQVGERTLREIRQITGGEEAGERLVKKVANDELSRSDIQEIKEEVKAGSDLDEVVKEVEKDDETGDIRVRTEVTFTGSKAEAVDRFAKERGMSKQRLVREAIDYYLRSEGVEYLEDEP